MADGEASLPPERRDDLFAVEAAVLMKISLVCCPRRLLLLCGNDLPVRLKALLA